MKATNKGTCQCCGAIQKLPNGKLSKHGYTVDWGMFSGTCQGAGELPFEQSFELIEYFIDLAQKSVTKLLLEVNEVAESVDPTSVWYYKYIKYSGGQYVWEKRAIILDSVLSENYTRWLWETLETDNYDVNRGSGGVGNGKSLIEDVVKYENAKYIKSLKKRVDGILNYIQWQEGRIVDWKEEPLKPLT